MAGQRPMDMNREIILSADVAKEAEKLTRLTKPPKALRQVLSRMSKQLSVTFQYAQQATFYAMFAAVTAAGQSAVRRNDSNAAMAVWVEIHRLVGLEAEYAEKVLPPQPALDVASYDEDALESWLTS